MGDSTGTATFKNIIQLYNDMNCEKEIIAYSCTGKLFYFINLADNDEETLELIK